MKRLQADCSIGFNKYATQILMNNYQQGDVNNKFYLQLTMISVVQSNLDNGIFSGNENNIPLSRFDYSECL
jgi:hypothetical protein